LWAVSEKTARDEEILDATVGGTGAVIMGRRTFDIVDAPGGWDDEMGYGAERDQSAAAQVFVLTHSVPEKVRLRDRFRFVTDGPASAIAQAKSAAGGKDVVIMGGGSACSEFLAAGLVDVLSIHLVPNALGAGTRLFPADLSLRLELISSESTAYAEHLTYRVLSGD
jgi:dihydrofolate reductase